MTDSITESNSFERNANAVVLDQKYFLVRLVYKGRSHNLYLGKVIKLIESIALNKDDPNTYCLVEMKSQEQHNSFICDERVVKKMNDCKNYIFTIVKLIPEQLNIFDGSSCFYLEQHNLNYLHSIVPEIQRILFYIVKNTILIFYFSLITNCLIYRYYNRMIYRLYFLILLQKSYLQQKKFFTFQIHKIKQQPDELQNFFIEKLSQFHQTISNTLSLQ